MAVPFAAPKCSGRSSRISPPRSAWKATDRNRGKGHALRRGLDMATTPYRVYTDVDLAYDPEER